MKRFYATKTSPDWATEFRHQQKEIILDNIRAILPLFMLKSTVNFFDNQKNYDPVTAPVSGVVPDIEAVRRQDAFENKLPPPPQPLRSKQLLGGAITITLPPRSPKQP